MLEKLFAESSVMEDVNDLDEGFGYYRPLMDEDDEAKSTEPKPKRGRPSKDPSAAMSASQKAERRAALVAAYERMKSRQS